MVSLILWEGDIEMLCSEALALSSLYESKLLEAVTTFRYAIFLKFYNKRLVPNC